MFYRSRPDSVRFVFLSLPCCLSLAVWGAALHAAELPGEKTGKPVSETKLDPITVTEKRVPGTVNLKQPSQAASRIEMTPLQTPASVTLIPGDFVRDWGYNSIAEAQSTAPGVGITTTPGNGGNTFSFRGFYGAGPVVQLYDGMQLFQAGGAVTFPSDPWNVERIEVLAGPSSVLSGTGAIGGTLNVVSLKPDPTGFHHRAQVSGGSYKTFSQAIDSTGPINDKFSYRVSLSNRSSDGWVDGLDSKSTSLNMAVRYDVTPDLKLTLSNAFTNQNPAAYEGTPTLNGKVVKAFRKKNYNVSDAQVRFVDNWTSLKADWQITPNLSFHNNAYAMYHHRKYREAYEYVYDPATELVQRKSYRDIYGRRNQYGDHGYFDYRHGLFGLKNQVAVGFDVNYSIYDRDHASPYTPTGPDYISAWDPDQGEYADLGRWATSQYRNTVKHSGVFMEDRIELSEQVSLVGGLRYDNYDLEYESRAKSSDPKVKTNLAGGSWRIGAVYEPIRDLSLYAQYSTANEPTGALASMSTSTMQDKMTTAQSWEVGVKQSLFNNRFEWTLAGYQIVKKRLSIPSVANPDISLQVGKQSSYGVEASASLRLVEGLRIEANGAILNSEYDTFRTKTAVYDGNRPYGVPEHLANVWVTYDFLKDWQARASFKYVGTRYADSANLKKLPGYEVFGLGLRWKPRENFDLDLRVDNLFDKIYARSAYMSSSSTDWLLGDPCTVTLTLNIRF